ncbi:hypothetical protein GHA01_15050 [Novacetimonas hansenii]|uniref:DUF4236 domain-containing protein n=1 Tax=Novacetimonas hansenii TaxID=436 RepID=A0ABQ0SEH5_NOVHA|nr:hypothetical protein GHA01_15050 [Novacetimonas hansenii]
MYAGKLFRLRVGRGGIVRHVSGGLLLRPGIMIGVLIGIRAGGVLCRGRGHKISMGW